MNTAIKRSGRPKVSPSDLCLRRIGKSFESANQLLSAYKSSKEELREKGRGKQPFNNYIKSLQEKAAMYKSYLELLSIYADNAGYEIDIALHLTDEDMEAPWKKLKTHYRDLEGKSLSLEKEFEERREVFSGNCESYNKKYPYIEWNGFWLESEINAAQRLSSQAIMSFDMLNVEFMSLDEALLSKQARKGRETFLNKKGKNTKDIFSVMHSKIVRYKNRLRKAIEELGYTEDEFKVLDMASIVASGRSEHAKKVQSANKLNTTIEIMEDKLNSELLKANPEQALNFKLSMAKKKLLPLTKKKNKGQITPLEEVQMANINKEIKDLSSQLTKREAA